MGSAVDMSTLISAMGTAFGTIKDDVLSLFNTALPIALSIFGVGLAITLGIRFFKSVAKNK